MTDQTPATGSISVIAQAFAEGTMVHEVDLLIAGDILRALNSSGYKIVRADSDVLTEATREALTLILADLETNGFTWRERVARIAAILEGAE